MSSARYQAMSQACAICLPVLKSPRRGSFQAIEIDRHANAMRELALFGVEPHVLSFRSCRNCRARFERATVHFVPRAHIYLKRECLNQRHLSGKTQNFSPEKPSDPTAKVLLNRAR
jgi:hypothetical protein